MKKFVITAVFVMAALIQGQLASAQYVHSVTDLQGNQEVTVSSGEFEGRYTKSPLVAQGKDLLFLVNPINPATDLQLRSVLSDADFEAYKKANKAVRVGYALDKVTIVTMLSSGLFTLTYGFGALGGFWEVDKKVLYGAGAVAGVGLACQLVAIPLEGANVRKIHKIADKYNDSVRENARLAFGTTGNGVGLALVF